MREYKEPVLVVMAAGMGSRYGGLKQIDPVDAQGDKIIDFSVYDAWRAGFRKVIFIIKRELEEAFREAIGTKMEGKIAVEYVYQELTNLPEGFTVPEGRTKPWGTGQAVLSCLGKIHGPFAVINADDYYGPKAFALLYDYLTTHEDDAIYRYAMVGYRLKNTVTENGSVSRGVCTVNEAGNLVSVREYTKIEKRENGIFYTEDDGKTYETMSEDLTVSMNFWGFTESVLGELKAGFARFLKEDMPKNPLKSEYYLPAVISFLLKEERAGVEVLTTDEAWFGVTYQEDRRSVREAVEKKKADGLYPEYLWG